MDKLAYHYNKKKLPAKTEGKYLYYYPCEDMESATVQMGGRGFVTIEVTEKEWDDFYHLKYLTDISDRLEWLERYNDVSETVANDISAKIKELRKQLGLQNRWEYVVE